ncbi:MAG: dephospho-CoA kinase [Candidatus Omnitrophica bacterium]|nr:dephospho-CoA kinase [Candidatus Omnitrophota bacterium]
MSRQGRSKTYTFKQGGKKRIILGVTGGLSTGKTTVAKILRSSGAQIIDADRIAHRIIKPSGKIYKRLVNAFGDNILKMDKTIDRDKLAKAVFNNKNLLKRLNRIVHPEIISIIKNQIRSSSKKVIVLDAPLLIEAGLRKLADKIIVVKTTRKKQLQRVANNKPLLKRREVLSRINAQMPLEDKVRIADFVIDNSGTVEETKVQIKQIRRLLWKS